jgi:hypothetical protein
VRELQSWSERVTVMVWESNGHDVREWSWCGKVTAMVLDSNGNSVRE